MNNKVQIAKKVVMKDGSEMSGGYVRKVIESVFAPYISGDNAGKTKIAMITEDISEAELIDYVSHASWIKAEMECTAVEGETALTDDVKFVQPVLVVDGELVG